MESANDSANHYARSVFIDSCEGAAFRGANAWVYTDYIRCRAIYSLAQYLCPHWQNLVPVDWSVLITQIVVP
jgi:hypothetical protein